MKTIYGSRTALSGTTVCKREDIWISHAVDGRMIIHFENDIDGAALRIEGWRGIAQDQFSNGVREATDTLVNELMHCDTVVLTVNTTVSGSILLTIDGGQKGQRSVQYRVMQA